ncbi:glucosaminidase domain-containing protein [Chitinasiproducens palmae]|uniref:Flagellar protein FlgJ n=1 Tax=Chitinasiproducens palmae TaxID=1770053 RepID=A0A1H2PMI5_9BURK|nr:glucosaminidase domain-containing protein [Chitinasiproducens palmae]SDV46946.1 flagellar protein FlgJ [Chitinasiproducens palmae]
MSRFEAMNASRAPLAAQVGAGGAVGSVQIASPNTRASGEYARLHAEIARTVAFGFAPLPRRAAPREPTPAVTAAPRARNVVDASAARATVVARTPRLAPARAGSSAQERFLGQILPHAERVARRLGVAPELIAAHAALESGWGTRPIPGRDGKSSHNLFGIKAGDAWRGASSAAWTTEFARGAARRGRDEFRTYPGFSAAFDDYASLLLENSRYSGLVNAGSDARRFARALQAGGYATDPRYASKLAQLAEQIGGYRASTAPRAARESRAAREQAAPGRTLKERPVR